MAQSYGMITIVDNTDLGQLSFYLSGNTLKEQIKDVNNNNYYPDWSIGSPFIVAPNVVYDGTGMDESTDSRIHSITWYHTAINENNKITTTTSSAAEYIDGKLLKRTINLTSSGRKYIAVLKFHPIPSDPSIEMEAVAEIELTYQEYGANAKALQLTGSGSHFIYQYTGDLINNTPITLTVQKQCIGDIYWYCDNQPIYSNNGSPTLTDTGVRYTNLTLTVVGKATTGYINITDLSTGFSSNKEASFRVEEANVVGGFEDYFSIYKIDEASPGTSTYTAYLDNDNETVNIYDNVLDLTNAISTLYIERGGVNDISNWNINIAASSGISYTASKNSNNSGPYNNKITITGMSVNSGQVTFTATKTHELSEDIAVDSNKTYYTRSISNNAYIYTEVPQPTGNPNANAYYELIPTVTLTKKFSISKSSTLISHSLRLSGVNANRTTENVYSPATITIAAITRTGGGGTTDYTDTGVITLIIHPVSGSQVVKTNQTPPITLDLATLKNNSNVDIGPIDYIEVFLGGTAAQSYDDAEDKQTISISVNGADSWQVNLKQIFDSIQTSADYKTKVATTYEIPFDIFKGINLINAHYPTVSNTVYPTVTATSANSTIQSLLTYYYGNTLVNSGTGVVDRIKFTVPVNTNIGSSGEVTLTFNLDGTHTVAKTYSYRAIPEALNAISLRILQDPSDTFENQTGINYAKATVLNGIDNISTQTSNSNFIYIKNYKWYYYDASVNPAKWKVLINSGTPTSEQYYSSNIQVGSLGANDSFTVGDNNTNSSRALRVSGAAIEGCGSFKLEVVVCCEGNDSTYSEIVTFKDVNDPIQVHVNSTLGLQLKNGQGVGAIYARVYKNNSEIDEIVSDNFLGIGTSIPENTNTGSYMNKLGWIYFNPSNGYRATYYSRSSTSDSWSSRQSQSGRYEWSFRDSNNEPVTANTILSGGIHADIHSSIKTIINNNNESAANPYYPQFIYLDKDVVNTKITAMVKVTVD